MAGVIVAGLGFTAPFYPLSNNRAVLKFVRWHTCGKALFYSDLVKSIILVCPCMVCNAGFERDDILSVTWPMRSQ